MTQLNPAFLNELQSIVGESNIITDPVQLDNNSRDCYWFSPVLKPKLDGKVAEVIGRPGTVEEMRDVIALAVRNRVPVTMRGAGTGNYGQGIPLQGGVLLNTKRLDQILELSAEQVRVQAGALLISIERAARKVGAELRFYPSTLMTATAGGFLAGGSGGVGSVTWGTLWDEGNVLGATIMTIEEEPRLLTVSDPTEMQGVVHNCGLTCVIVDLTLAMTTAKPWSQYVVAFDDFDSSLHFGQALAYDDTLAKRLITPLEWPIPTFFKQLIKEGGCPEGKAIVLLTLVSDAEAVSVRAAPFGGKLVWSSPSATYLRKGILLSDFAWNHTTMWAIKTDARWTYLQDQFSPDGVFDQLHQIKARYGNDFLRHIEFMKFRGVMVPQGLSIVRYHSDQQIAELINFCESIGVWIANPHTHRLDEDVRWNGQPILDAKRNWDPHGLLNPGHLTS